MNRSDLARRWPLGELRVERLENGLELLFLDLPRAPVVTTALTYRVGARDDPPGAAGTAHFLEHLMFRGSAGYAAGEIDRLTQALGGENNAFTSHDTSSYYFSFARDRWMEALRIEADRMRGLKLDVDDVEMERTVILEEIAMYRTEPWEALVRSVQAALYGSHPYGRTVLGTAGEVGSVTVRSLEAFHQRAYQPGNAVLALAGGLGGEAMALARELFGSIEGEASPRAESPPVRWGDRLSRVTCRRGEIPRVLLALPICSAGHEDYPPLRLLSAVLGSGRASRLHRRLVDEEELCVWASTWTSENELPGSLNLAAEVVPGGNPAKVEAVFFEELRRLRSGPLEPAEIDRARNVLLADWLFEHETVQQQALTLSQAAAVFTADTPRAQLEVIAAADADQLCEIARRYADPEAGAVLGWGGTRRPGQE